MQLRDLRKQFKWRHLRAKRKKKGLEEVQDRYSFLPPFLCQSSPSGIPCPIRKSDLLLAYPSSLKPTFYTAAAAAAAKSCQSCPTLCDSIDSSPPGSAVPGILQARTLEWVAISFSNAWKWKVKVKLLSHVWLLAIPWTAAYQAPPSLGFSRQEYWSGSSVPSPHLLHKGIQIKLTAFLPLRTGGFCTLPIYHGLHWTEPFHSCSQGCPLCHTHMHFVLFPRSCVGVAFSPCSFLYAKSECVSCSVVPNSFRSHGE